MLAKGRKSSPWTEENARGVALGGEVPVPQVAAADRELHLVERERFPRRDETCMEGWPALPGTNVPGTACIFNF